MHITQDQAQHIITLATRAGKKILHFYKQPLDVSKKDDNSPLTQADLAAHTLLTQELALLFPGIPIISEEAALPDTIPALFWLVDPLDGTKEFINQSDEFTVNIALVEHGRPIFGVVHLPALGATYFSTPDGAHRIAHEKEERIHVSDAHTPLRVVASKSHLNEETRAYIDTLSDHTLVTRGSSLKFCTIAEGNADIYPRFGRTMEWDTAAAHAVLNAAGGAVLLLDGSPLQYGKESLANPYFIAIGDTQLKQKVKP